jgi:hypothetical protein
MGVRTWDLGDYFWSRRNKKYGYLGKYWDRSPYRDEVWVNHVEEAVFYYLHGHAIAVWRFEEGKLEVSDCGYVTQTTYSRLDMILSKIGFHAFRHHGLGFIKDCKKGLYYPMFGRREIDLNTRIVTDGDGGMAYVLDSDTFWLAENLYHTLRRYGILFGSIVGGNIRLSEEEERKLRRRTRERIADLTLRLIFLRESFSRWVCMMLFFREEDGDAKLVDTRDGIEAIKAKRSLLKQGYEHVLTVSSKYYSIKYLTYRCRSCGKFEVFYVMYHAKYALPVYKELQLRLMEMLQDCRYKKFLPTDRHSFNLSKLGYKGFFLKLVRKLDEAGMVDEAKALMADGKLAGKVVAKMRGKENFTAEDIADAIASVMLEDEFKSRRV